MEVHHTHQPAHKKKWNEYLLEFFMLFFAVTLGFFAENIREHYVEKEREVKYLKNIHQDLKKDLEEIDTTIYYIDMKQTMADSLFEKIKSNKIMENLSDFYYYNKSLGLRHLFENATNGFTQLNNSGGLRLIENKEIISKIQNYINYTQQALSLQEFNENTLLNYRLKSARILNVITSTEMNEAQKLNEKRIYLRFSRPIHPLPLLSNNKEDINEVFNLILGVVNTNKYFKARLLGIRERALQLDKLLVEEYGKDF